MNLLLLILCFSLLITILAIRRSRRKRVYGLQSEMLRFDLRKAPAFAPRLPDFTPVRLKVGDMFATVDAPTKSLKRIEYTLPK